ncbi:MAG: histidine kinase [Spirochaetaceae bacterium]
MNKNRRIWQLILDFKFQSIYIRNLLIITLLFIIPLIIINIIVFEYSTSYVMKEIKTFNTNNVLRVRDSTDNILVESNRIAAMIVNMDKVKYFIPKYNSEMDLYNSANSIQDDLLQFILIEEYLHSIFIFSELNENIISNSDFGNIKTFNDMSWYESYNKNKNNESRWIISRKYKDIYPYLMSLIKPISTTEGRILGAVIININAEVLGNMSGVIDNSFSENLSIIDNDGLVLYNKNLNYIERNLKNLDEFRGFDYLDKENPSSYTINDEKKVITVVDSDFGPYKYILSIPLKNFDNEYSKMRRYFIIFVLISVLLSAIATFIISIRTYEPLRNILSIIDDSKGIQILAQGTGDQKSINETKYIINSILKTEKMNHEMEKELSYKLSLLNRAQTVALQYQINPHFLINTLDTINWTAIGLTNSENKVSSMVASLADLFRLSLDAKDNLISIENELEYVKKYLFLLEIRYPDKFNVIWDIKDEVLTYKIVKLSIQPLVENAVYHGIKPKRQKGNLTIRCFLDGDNICVEVEDDGVGLNESKVDEIKKLLSQDYTVEVEHIGLCNINQRVKLIFGQEFGIALKSNRNKGSVVSITFPAINKV